VKNIFNIAGYDLRKITGSVVAIITILGLCIVPCLYAWFNIFSNWSPYESEATGRISVSVVSEDEGTEILGLSINVGDKIIEALKGNDQIGWRFEENEDAAIEGVRSGDYYAAIVIPEDFSRDVLSFVSGEMDNPTLVYYENEKKNAIAPKITGKAKSALEAEVDAAFIETIAEYLSKAVAASEATGYDPQDVFADLSAKLDDLSTTLESCVVMVDAAAGLTGSADDLLQVSGTLIGDAETTLDKNKDLLKTTEKILPKTKHSGTEITDTTRRETKDLIDKLASLEKVLNHISKNMDDYNKFIDVDLSAHNKAAGVAAKAAKTLSDALKKLGFTALSDRFGTAAGNLSDMSDLFGKMEKANEDTWPEQQALLKELLQNTTDTKELIQQIYDDMEKTNLDGKLDESVGDARSAIEDVCSVLDNMNSDMSGLSGVLRGFEGSLGSLNGGLDRTRAAVRSMQGNLGVISGMLSGISNDEALNDLHDLLAQSDDVVSYMASPIRMNTEIVYPVREYGSAMAPFYTVLAQWVGSLLAAVLIKAKVKKREGLENPSLVERFFGRYGLFLLVGLSQGLIVSLGDLLYIGIQCTSPVLFVLAACVNGIAFTMINYALAFALDNIGLAAGVIILVLQVAGGGGTYPIEVLPSIFRKMYPFMPFRYSMDAMRECVCGMYDSYYAKCIGILGLFTIGAVIFGLVFYYPALKLNKMIAESKEKSEIML